MLATKAKDGCARAVLKLCTFLGRPLQNNKVKINAFLRMSENWNSDGT